MQADASLRLEGPANFRYRDDGQGLSSEKSNFYVQFREARTHRSGRMDGAGVRWQQGLRQRPDKGAV